MEQNNNYMRNRDVGGKEQIKAMIEWNTIYTRNGDVRGNKQIIAFI
jgi:hypothetical protein